MAQVIDPQGWSAHEGSLDPPSLLLQWRFLLVLRLERNPVGQKYILVLAKQTNKKTPQNTACERLGFFFLTVDHVALRFITN